MPDHPRLGSGRRPIVFTIIAVILASIIAFTVSKQKAIAEQHAKEKGLAVAVTTLRNGIQTYHSRSGKYPPSLDALLKSQVLKQIPIDPVTGSAQTWRVETEESVSVDDFTARRMASQAVIVDIHSGASGRDSSGKAYSEY